MLNPYQSVQPAAPCVPSQPASSSSASMVPVKPAPMSRNPSMAAAPVNAPLPQSMGSRSMGRSQDEATAPVTASYGTVPSSPFVKGSTELAETRAR